MCSGGSGLVREVWRSHFSVRALNLATFSDSRRAHRSSPGSRSSLSAFWLLGRSGDSVLVDLLRMRPCSASRFLARSPLVHSTSLRTCSLDSLSGSGFEEAFLIICLLSCDPLAVSGPLDRRIDLDVGLELPLLGFGRVSARLLGAWLVVASEPPQGRPGVADPFGRICARFRGACSWGFGGFSFVGYSPSVRARPLCLSSCLRSWSFDYGV